MSMRTLQLGVFLALLVAARAVPTVDVSDALGRPLQYDELDREHRSASLSIPRARSFSRRSWRSLQTFCREVRMDAER